MNEELLNASGEEMSGTDTDYVQAINELKANTVSKANYEKLRNENKKLLDALVNGQQIDVQPEKKPDVNELRRKLFTAEADLSNIDYVSNMLELRKALIAEGQPDPFAGIGDKAKINGDVLDSAERVAEGLQYCVDFAQGDSGIFTAQLQRITRDTPTIRRSR